MLSALWARVKAGESVEFRPRGDSMTPIIRSGQLVRVDPFDPEGVGLGDVVLVRVAGSTYLHLVKAVDKPRRRVQIANNHGRINGWAGFEKIAGRCTHVDGVARAVSAQR